MECICDNCRNANQCDSAKTMLGIRIECSMFIPKATLTDMLMHGFVPMGKGGEER